MRKFLKIIRNIFLFFVAIIVLILTGLFINNQVKLKKEEGYWKNPPGEMVEVDGHKMHVYTEGAGDHTILLLSGFSGTSPSPYQNFLPLCKELAKDNKVVIIEKFGYGLSDVVGGKRDFDTILEQDREALKKLGIEGPYVLCPHSLSGIESLIWAQTYPEEVEAIVGMDMSDSSIKGDEEMDVNALRIMGAIRATGLIRFMSPDGDQTEMETAILCKTFANKTLISECENVDAACDEVDSKPLPTTPTLQFVAMKKHTVEEAETWKASHQKIVDASSNGKLVELDCEHYVYRFEQDRIVQEINDYLNNL